MKKLGINALVYAGGDELPQRNEWSITVSREMHEGRVFQSAGAGASWVDQTAGFRSWSGSINGYYDDSDDTATDLTIGSNSSDRGTLLLYEDRNTLTNYWYGLAWFEMSQTTSVDGFVELNIDYTGDGPLSRFSA